jgi:inorganic triphosphatase YgiF
VRRVGRRWVQTVKADTEVRAGISNPVEIEGEVGGIKPELSSVPDRAVRKQIKKALDGSALVPVFETVVRRTTRRLRVGEQGEVELALDHGVVRSPAGSSEIREAELELKSGTAGSLLTVAEALLADEPLRVAQKSKAKKARRFLKQLKSLQETFGYLNDVATAKKLMELPLRYAADTDLQRAVGCVLGWHAARANDAWTTARARWLRLDAAPRFWARH